MRVMRNLVDQAQADPEFVRFAVDLVRNVAAYDEFGELNAIFSWVLGNIRYTKDPVSKEKLYPPKELLKIGAGDCDDMTMLLAALALALGYPARVVTVAANGNFPNDFSHVYPQVEAPPGSGNWVALDAARPGSAFGLEPDQVYRKRIWSLTDDSHHDMKGCTRLRGLAGLGQTDWGGILSQSITEIPQIIAVTSGQSSNVRMPSGTVVSTGPYASFATPYTPGYAAPAAGYGSLSSASGDLFSSALPWILAGVVALAVFRK